MQGEPPRIISMSAPAANAKLMKPTNRFRRTNKLLDVSNFAAT